MLTILPAIFRDALAVKAGGTGFLSGQEEAARKLAAKLPARALLRLIEACGELNGALMRNANLTLTLTRMCPMFRQAAFG